MFLHFRQYPSQKTANTDHRPPYREYGYPEPYIRPIACMLHAVPFSSPGKLIYQSEDLSGKYPFRFPLVITGADKLLLATHTHDSMEHIFAVFPAVKDQISLFQLLRCRHQIHGISVTVQHRHHTAASNSQRGPTPLIQLQLQHLSQALHRYNHCLQVLKTFRFT